MPPIIDVRDLHVSYKQLHALKGVSFSIPENGITALIGASGSGKSSFLRSLNRMLDTVPHAEVAGEIYFRGHNILRSETDVIALRRSVGMVFQNPTPFPLSVYDNVAYGLEIQGVRNPFKRRFLPGWRKRLTANQVESSTDPLTVAVVQSLKEAALWGEVKDRLHHSAYRLSGGQQQRLCIARAIAVRPDVLLLDEPCSALDPISTHKIEQLLLQLKKDYTIIIVTHNLHQAQRISDFTGFFHLGDFVEFGETKAMFGNAKERLTRDYVGGQFG